MQDHGPLPLHQVLEEEYATLHGTLPNDYYDDNDTADERLKALNDHIHALAKQGDGRTALCISGGGIRSATFALGVIQGLARLRLLDKFHYLSTVSGGGYIGSWLSAWMHRAPGGSPDVCDQLRSQSSSSVLEPEARPIRHLRDYSNYLSPQLGLLSADTWTLVATVVRNLILNWTVFIPLLAAALIVPRIYMALISLDSVSNNWLTIFIAAAFLAGVIAVVYMGLFRPTLRQYQSPGLKRWAGQGGFLWLCLLPSVGLAFLLTVYWAWLRKPGTSISQQLSPILGLHIAYPWPFLLFGLIVYLVAGVIFMFWLKRFKLQELAVAVPVGLAGGALLWFAATMIFPLDDKEASLNMYACFALPLILGLFLLAVVLFVGIASSLLEDEDREWLARYGAWMLIAMGAWSAIGFIVIYGPWLLLYGTKTTIATATAGGVSGLLTVLFGRSNDTAANNKQAAQGQSSAFKNIALALAAPVFVVIFLMAMSLGTSALIVLIEEWLQLQRAGQTTFLHSLDDHLNIIRYAPIYIVIALFAALLLVGIVMALFININKFSLHAMYRNRLIRAYLGASRMQRHENPFTGFDPEDNMALHELRPELFHLSSFIKAGDFVTSLEGNSDPLSQHICKRLPRTLAAKKEAERTGAAFPINLLIKEMNDIVDGDSLYNEEWFKETEFDEEINRLLSRSQTSHGITLLNRLIIDFTYGKYINPFRNQKPLHIVNMALNLVRGSKLAWQQRKAESFTASPLHSGSCFLSEETTSNPGSYRRSKEYGGSSRSDGTQGISLGTAVAISGAAVSPNMGYHSSPALTFLLTLFNARLGWWLGNPGKAGEKSYRYSSPLLSIRPLIAEALGLTDDTNRYIYLSDGGHFENLGLYEMVLRRCHYIVVSDAGADPECAFDDLGTALRKIRIDFGIPIDISKMLIRARGGQSGAYCAIGTIKYEAVDGVGAPDGTLIYIKPAFYEVGPTDVFNYAKQSKTFPHESTADQFFTEAQFESYRRLGSYIVETIMLGNFTISDWPAFTARCEEYIASVSDPGQS